MKTKYKFITAFLLLVVSMLGFAFCEESLVLWLMSLIFTSGVIELIRAVKAAAKNYNTANTDTGNCN